jgi:hypothetical protein
MSNDLEIGCEAGLYGADLGVMKRAAVTGQRAGLLIEPLDAAPGDLEPDRRESPESNRRRARRYRVLISGMVVHADFGASVPCIIRNLSEGGAGISIDDNWKAPEKFWLIRTVERLACEATPAWRHGSFAGLRLGPAFDLADPENPTAARLLEILTAAAED